MEPQHSNFFDRNRSDSPLGFRIFDWEKAAQLIKENNMTEVMGGLAEDWTYTSVFIYKNGYPVLTNQHKGYLVSRWATPILMDVSHGNTTYECWRVAEHDDVDPETFWWPDDILKALTNDIVILDLPVEEDGTVDDSEYINLLLSILSDAENLGKGTTDAH